MATASATLALSFRPAGPADAPLLRQWDEEPHVVVSDPNDDWRWEIELAEKHDWRESWIAEVGRQPIGFLQIIDPAREESRYWGDVPDHLRAIDIWIGEAAFLNRGFGTRMMTFAIERCFTDACVTAILIDPLERNASARRFYERLGFAPVGPRRFGDDDCFVYSLARETWDARKP